MSYGTEYTIDQLVDMGFSILLNNMLVPAVMTAMILLAVFYLRQKNTTFIKENYPFILIVSMVLWLLLFVLWPQFRELIYFPIYDPQY